jgi:hypothetical protein
MWSRPETSPGLAQVGRCYMRADRLSAVWSYWSGAAGNGNWLSFTVRFRVDSYSYRKASTGSSRAALTAG